MQFFIDDRFYELMIMPDDLFLFIQRDGADIDDLEGQTAVLAVLAVRALVPFQVEDDVSRLFVHKKKYI